MFNQALFTHRQPSFGMKLTILVLFFSATFLLPRTASADSFVIDIAPQIDWIQSSSISLGHDAGGFYFSGTSFWVTVNQTGVPNVEGELIYFAEGTGPGNDGIGGSVFAFPLFTGSNLQIQTQSPTEYIIIATETRLHDDDFIQHIQGPSTFTGTHGPNPTIPEPATFLLLSTGLLGLAGYRWQQRRREGSQVG